MIFGAAELLELAETAVVVCGSDKPTTNVRVLEFFAVCASCAYNWYVPLGIDLLNQATMSPLASALSERPR